MNETNPIGNNAPTPQRAGVEPKTAPVPKAPRSRGLKFYAQGGLMFFKKMWPALYDLSTTETYVNASAIAFNVMLSFFSFAVLMGSFLNNVLNWETGYRTSFRLMRAVTPDAAKELFDTLDKVTRGPGGKATIISFALMIYSASGIFQPIEAALNRAWGFKERDFIKQYATYLALAVACVLIMLGPVALASGYDYLIIKVAGLFSVTVSEAARTYVIYILGPIILLPFIALMLFIVYYFVPNGKVDASQMIFTAIATALLWMIAMFGYWLALPLLDFKGSYYELASLMTLVTWVFISSFILILGANLSAHKVLPESWTGYLPFRKNAATTGVAAQKNA